MVYFIIPYRVIYSESLNLGKHISVTPQITRKITLTYQSNYRTYGPSWPWSYGSLIYNYLCNQYLLPLILWVRISIMARSTTLCDKVCQWLAAGRWFSPGPHVSSVNKTDRHDITEILLKVALSIINQPNKQTLTFPSIIHWRHSWILLSRRRYLILITSLF
jgi:hypothetical protein